MATDRQESKRRKIETIPRKLLTVHEKVEVRRLEDGFLGSWHTATVICCEDLSRLVQFDHILDGDGSTHLIESVKVSPLLDGLVTEKIGMSSNYPNMIRPLPPSCILDPRKLHCGQLVDCFYRDAWWEGVIFDHKDGEENQNVFFPDMGDEVDARIDMLRLSQDWDEVTEEWKPRANWLFLEILEELEHSFPLPVSVKQIWYELRVMSGFEELKHWNSSERSIWRNLVLQTLSDNFKIFYMHLVKELNSAWDSAPLGQSLLEFPESVLDSILQSERLLDNSAADIPYRATSHHHQKQVEKNDAVNLEPVVNLTSSGKALSLSHDLPTLLNNADKVSQRAYSNYNDYASSMGVRLSDDEFMHRKSLAHRPVPDIVAAANYFPNAIAEANEKYKLKKVTSQVSINARKCLLELGWKIEYVQHEKRMRHEYLSPDGKRFKSLKKICQLFDSVDQELAMPSQLSAVNPNSRKKVPSPLIQKPQASNKLPKFCTSDVIVVEPEYYPESVNDYFKNCSSRGPRKNLKLDAWRAKRHLSATGWSIEHNVRGGTVRSRYRSPTGRSFDTLRAACKWCLQFGTASQNNTGPTLGDMGNVGFQDDCTPGLVVIEPEYCPESIKDYCNKYFPRGHGKNWKLDAWKAKRHLSASGWSFDYVYKQDRWVMRYRSPTGRSFYSLLSACKWCLQVSTVLQDDYSRPTVVEIGTVSCVKNSAEPISVNQSSNLRQTVVDSVEKIPMVNDTSEKPLNQSQGLFDMLEAEVHKNRIQRKSLKHHKVFPSGTSLPRRRGRRPSGLRNVRNTLNTIYSTRFQSNRRAGEVSQSSPPQTSKNILSWLIDNNVVLPRSKVKCPGNTDSHPVQHGRITREGIKCSCCRKSLSLSSFQRHAGVTNSIPAANIFLQDGRSLLDCQAQLNRNKSNGNPRSESCENVTRSQKNRSNDNVCAICCYGGELVLCDQCPSSFHTHCLGLKEVPCGHWCCPSCCCKICGQGLDQEIKPITETCILVCDQCEQKYHVGCVNIEGVTQLKRYTKGFWFCRDTCEQIYYGLRKSLGMPVSLGTGNLCWTLVKYIKPESHDHHTFDTEYLIESQSKLHIALSLVHECFEPIEEPGTTDLLEDVIFSRSSELNRLNFQGFYTVLLEKDDELISAATVRIYGNRVAEIPLVTTSTQYRRLGMCRVLMNELEKKLMELGVERLVLPAVPSVLDTWTKSFGFSVMNESERLSLLDYSFLCFQGTVICQKLLTGVCSSASSLSTEGYKKVGHDVTENVYTELDSNSTVTEAPRADQVGAIDDGTEDNCNNDHVVQVDQPDILNHSC